MGIVRYVGLCNAADLAYAVESKGSDFRVPLVIGEIHIIATVLMDMDLARQCCIVSHLLQHLSEGGKIQEPIADIVHLAALETVDPGANSAPDRYAPGLGVKQLLKIYTSFAMRSKYGVSKTEWPIWSMKSQRCSSAIMNSMSGLAINLYTVSF